MRVTNKMLSQTVLTNLNANLKRLQKLQNQMSTGHVVSRPSDDPVVGARVMNLDTIMKQHSQYERNMDDALGWLETTEQALGGLTDALQRARELAVYGANGSLSQTDRDALAKEVKELTGNVVQIANTSYAGRYIFAGTKTTTAPFDADGKYNGNSGAAGRMNWEISQGVTMTVNIDGNDAFNPASINPVTLDGSYKIFNMLHDLQTALESSDTTNLSGAILQNLDQAIENTLNLRAAAGAKCNRLEMLKNQFSSESINYEQLLSKLNDVDMAKIYTDYKMQEAVYQSALNTGARILQPTLLDFLR